MRTVTFDLAAEEVVQSNQRLHHRVAANRVANLRARAAAARAGLGEQMPAARCIAHLTFRDRRRRDANNWWPTTKALVDGLVTGSVHVPGPFVGILPDDDAAHLVGPDHRLTTPDPTIPGAVRVLLTFDELDGLPLPAAA